MLMKITRVGTRGFVGVIRGLTFVHGGYMRTDTIATTCKPRTSRNDAARDASHLLREMRQQWEREYDEIEAHEIALENRAPIEWLPHPSESMFAWGNGGPGLPGYDYDE